MCDEPVMGAECPACGADTDQIPVLYFDVDRIAAALARSAAPVTSPVMARPKMTRATREWLGMSFNRDDER
jgi:hypothetical protein